MVLHRLDFLEALIILSEWQVLYWRVVSQKGLTVTRKKVVVAVILIFSHQMREKEGCFCLGFYKD